MRTADDAFLPSQTGETKPVRLFAGSCCAVIAGAVQAMVLYSIAETLKSRFALTNQQIGVISGAGLWGCAMALMVCGSLCDALGMKRLVRLGLLAHLGGILMMIGAQGFSLLFAGALTISVGDGLLQAAYYPLVATLYSARKTEMFNKLLLWYPGGRALSGLTLFAVGCLEGGRSSVSFGGLENWQWRLCLIFVPVLAYAGFFLGQTFPATERLQSGVTFAQMFRETFFRPLFWLLLACMVMTASVKLGPSVWVTPVLESAGIPGVLVLVWISLSMAIVRYSAGTIGHRIDPRLLLASSAVLSGAGLLWLSAAQSLVMAVAAGTVFAAGVCLFWPTMLGLTSERIPRGGALALALMSGMGTLVAGAVTAPLMGQLADHYGHERLPVKETEVVLKKVIADANSGRGSQDADGRRKQDVDPAVKAATSVLPTLARCGELPRYDTARALRLAAAADRNSAVAKQVQAILQPADNYGGRISFRWISLISAILAIIFGMSYMRDRIA